MAPRQSERNIYTNVCRESNYEFSAFVFETYDLMAPQSISLLYRLAEIASTDVDIRDIAYRDSRKANKGRKSMISCVSVPPVKPTILNLRLTKLLHKKLKNTQIKTA